MMPRPQPIRRRSLLNRPGHRREMKFFATILQTPNADRYTQQEQTFENSHCTLTTKNARPPAERPYMPTKGSSRRRPQLCGWLPLENRRLRKTTVSVRQSCLALLVTCRP